MLEDDQEVCMYCVGLSFECQLVHVPGLTLVLVMFVWVHSDSGVMA